MSTLLRRPVDREILRLAVPALGALVAEPIFLLADSAMVGHLGVEPLAGLGIASAVLQTIVGLMVFLAYSTTPAVARRLGAGDLRGAVAPGAGGPPGRCQYIDPPPDLKQPVLRAAGVRVSMTPRRSCASLRVRFSPGTDELPFSSDRGNTDDRG